MDLWFTLAEIREALGVSQQATDKRSKKWQGSRKRRGTKTKEYPLSALPEDVREALGYPEIATETVINEPLRPEQITPKAPINRRVAADQRIDSRLWVLTELQNFLKENVHIYRVPAEYKFAAAYNSGEVEAPGWVREALPTISRSTLRRWQEAVRGEGVAALAGRYGHRDGDGKIDSQVEIKDLVVAMIVNHPHCSPAHVLQGIEARYPNSDLPSLRTLERWIARYRQENAQTLTAISNPDKWKSTYMVAFGSASEGIERPNQRWELDSTPGDLLLADGRYTIVGCLDVFTRRAMLLVTKTSKATAIAALMRKCLMAWGVPEEIKTDNGSDYTSNHIRRVVSGLDIWQELCPPFQPWHKPHIERFFRTFSHDLVELLPGYIGHNVSDRQEIRSQKSFADRLMKRGETLDIRRTADEFQQFCDDWTNNYQHRKHEGLGKKSPFEVLTAARFTARKIQNERALDVLLAEAPGNNGLRTVRKSGIQLDNAWFIAPELEAFVDQQVQVLYDVEDLGRIYVFGGPALEFICVAECPERTGISRRDVATRAKELQKRRVQEERKTLKQAARAARTDEIVDEILAQQKPNVVAFPSPTDIHDSQGLRSAAEAADALRPRQPQSTSAEELAQARAATERLEARNQPIEEPWEKYMRLRQLAQTNEDETAFMARFEQTPEGRGLLKVINATDDELVI